MQNLTTGDLIKIHDRLVDLSGEEHDILSIPELLDIINRHSKANTLVEKAAILLHEIPHLQPFSEGNKRTAFSSFKVFQELNGTGTRIPILELEDVIIKSVNNNITLNGVKKWLKLKMAKEKR